MYHPMFIKLFNILLFIYNYVCLFTSIYFYNFYYSIYKFSYLKNQNLFILFYKCDKLWNGRLLEFNIRLKINIIFLLVYLLLSSIFYPFFVFIYNCYYLCYILIIKFIINKLLLGYNFYINNILNKFIYFIIFYYIFISHIYLLSCKQLKIKPNFYKNDYGISKFIFINYGIFFYYYYIFFCYKKLKNFIHFETSIKKVIMKRKFKNLKIKLQNISILNILFVKLYIPLLQKLEKLMFWRKHNRKIIRIFFKSNYYRIKWNFINYKKKVFIKLNHIYNLFLHYINFYILNPYFNFLLKNKANNIFYNLYLTIKYVRSFCVWIKYKITKKKWKK